MDRDTAIQIAIDLISTPIENGFIYDSQYGIIENDIAFFVPLTHIDSEISITNKEIGFGFIIDKITKEFMRITISDSLNFKFDQFKIGFRDAPRDLIIKEIFDKEETIECLLDLKISYVIPELEAGEIWKIPKRFTSEEISLRLDSIPCQFLHQSFIPMWDYVKLKKVIDEKIFDFEFRKPSEYFKSIGGELIDKNGVMKKE